MRRRVRLDRVFGGITPEREAAGRRSTVTRSFSHRTPGQLHGVVRVVFQKRVRPPTEARRAKRAALSTDKSEKTVAGKKRKRRTTIVVILGSVRVSVCIFVCEARV